MLVFNILFISIVYTKSDNQHLSLCQRGITGGEGRNLRYPLCVPFRRIGSLVQAEKKQHERGICDK